MKSIDYLLVGQGIAGSLLAYRLIQARKTVRIIDSGLHHGSSIVAAGIINPITGRNYVKSWNFETLSTEITALYTELEQVLGISLLREVKILRTLFNTFDQNKWMSKSARPDYKDYLGEIEKNHEDWSPVLRQNLPLAVTHHGKLADLPLLVTTLRSKWVEAGILETGCFDSRNLSCQSDYVSYGDLRAKDIIFCEGNGILNNRFFKSLPMIGYIGEVLKVKIPDIRTKNILKQKSFLVPLNEQIFWFGPFDHPHNSFEKAPSENGRRVLVQNLKNIIQAPFEVVEHLAGVRPTVIDRKPILGTHPHFSRIHIFNGLGTKGASLAPYFSKLLVEYLIANKPIPKSVNIDRFKLIV